jgi:quinohemoprotein ethanol dehydrogenase
MRLKQIWNWSVIANLKDALNRIYYLKYKFEKRRAVMRFLSSALVLGTIAGLYYASQGAGVGTASAEQQLSDWSMVGGDTDEKHFSPLNEVNRDNVDRLGLAWSYEFDTNRGQEGTPLIVGGVIYTSTAWSKVFALDGATGTLLWKYDPKVPGRAGFNACCDVVNRGLAYNDGKIFLGTLDGRLQALDARTGKVIWTTMTVDSMKPYTVTGAPRVARGKVFIGNGGADYGVRGYVSAYDEKTGALIWRFYTVPGDPAIKDRAVSDAVLERLARPTWFGQVYVKTGGGGTVWDSIVYDKELNQLYIGVGNGSPDNHVLRSEGKGDNLFLASIVALDADTGRYLWHYQEVPGETWDYTATQQITLGELNVEGKLRKVLFQAPKNGFFYVLDRQSGKLLSAQKFAPVNWADHIDMITGRPVENPGARYIDKPFLATTGGTGAHNWQAMAFSPKTGLVYIPAQMLPGMYKRQEDWKFRPGRWNFGFDVTRATIPSKAADRAAMAENLKGWLLAWDPVAQREVWRVDHHGAWNGGVLATAGGLVFQGTADHDFTAYDAQSGKKLWNFVADAGIMGAPVAYRIGNQQYIAVMSGSGGALIPLPSFTGPIARPNGRLLVFAIGGRASLPAFKGAMAKMVPVIAHASAETVKKGGDLFADNCAACHGMNAWSGGIMPDLRRAAALGDAAAWRAIVYDGALQSQGMISFRDYLTLADVEAIRVFVAGQTIEAKPLKPNH